MQGAENLLSNYLIARNRVYIVEKHFGIERKLSSFWYFFVISILELFTAGILKGKRDRIERVKYCFMNVINGDRKNGEK